MQHTGQRPVTHHTTLSCKDWVTIDYKHTLQSIHSTLGRNTEIYPTTRDWDLPVLTYWFTVWGIWTRNPEDWSCLQQSPTVISVCCTLSVGKVTTDNPRQKIAKYVSRWGIVLDVALIQTYQCTGASKLDAAEFLFHFPTVQLVGASCHRCPNKTWGGELLRHIF
jgi:hypothetical protein